jgi:hypothetical protein
MKKIIKSGLPLIAIIIMFSGYFSSNALAQTSLGSKISYQEFYDNLSPYGTWIDYPIYGHVWSPRVEGDFRPYATDGNWVYSDEGWAWVSNYSWGWAPFHYGRWFYDDNYGWLWVPGYDWSPAWVTWGIVDNYYCWAPIMPDVNVGIQFGLWMPHEFYWNFVGRDHIYDRNISNVMEQHEHIHNVVNRISIMNNFNTTRVHKLFYSRGPEVNDVQKYTNQRINPMSIREVRKINQARREGNVIKVYRPVVQTPQPREFKRTEPNQIKPIRNNEQMPSVQRNEQRKNIEQLPTHRTTNPSNTRSPDKQNKAVNPSNTKSPARQSGDKRNK